MANRFHLGRERQRRKENSWFLPTPSRVRVWVSLGCHKAAFPNRGAGRATLPPEPLGEGPSLPLPASSGPRSSLVCGSIIYYSVSIPCGIFPLCLYVSVSSPGILPESSLTFFRGQKSSTLLGKTIRLPLSHHNPVPRQPMLSQRVSGLTPAAKKLLPEQEAS